MKDAIAERAVVMPLPTALIFINADRAGHTFPRGVIWNYQGQMPGFGNHRVSAITGALSVMARMHMYISDHRDALGPAVAPDFAKVRAIEFNDAIGKARWVNIIVEQELPHTSKIAGDLA